ncbi:pyridine nucleotide-disulfide oxidoreductase [Flexivirga endophytica]|uniref:Pyridine nucleotide-disulfide oxidoreductase n=1 Tax=Flexivirga endophytica TaxID=1849103 RepID=A0A916T4W4_9MICO|nr:FAD-dependent oxidoreductase [Flexivirga endophytica]GGB30924.1 pyridine nucleotide-disulfide oxidoreductase [Flexivirga endophytica]GHB51854.1 pyridine nucleotide-disulfide oxidoreductase [Flexivirga endophytica]
MTTDLRRLVVVGASLAGLRAVEAARRAGFTGSITLIGAERSAPYDRPPLSKALLRADAPASVSPFHTEEHLRTELGVDLRCGAPATGLDIDHRRVLVGADRVDYDGLIIATGAAANAWPLGAGVPGVHPLRTAVDALAIRAALDAGKRVAVIGAGFIGSEVASAARARDLPVTVIEAAPQPLTRSVGPSVADVLTGLHRSAGVDLRVGTQVTEVHQNASGVTGLTLGDGNYLPAELVVLGIGARPATGWLRDSGLALHRDGGVLVDATLATRAPGVYAAGDVAHAPLSVFDDEVVRLEHWTSAAEQGAAAARHLLDPDTARPLQTVPYFWSDWHGHRLQFVGVPTADEARVIRPEPEQFLALYRRGDRVVGAFTVNGQREIMRYRRHIVGHAPFEDALAEAGAHDRAAV